jgi:hypothetical protein
MNPVCIFRGIFRSIRASALVSGHDYKTDSEPTPKNVHVLKCMTCGHTSVCWSWDSIENLK